MNVAPNGSVIVPIFPYGESRAGLRRDAAAGGQGPRQGRAGVGDAEVGPPSAAARPGRTSPPIPPSGASGVAPGRVEGGRSRGRPPPAGASEAEHRPVERPGRDRVADAGPPSSGRRARCEPDADDASAPARRRRRRRSGRPPPTAGRAAPTSPGRRSPCRRPRSSARRWRRRRGWPGRASSAGGRPGCCAARSRPAAAPRTGPMT